MTLFLYNTAVTDSNPPGDPAEEVESEVKQVASAAIPDQENPSKYFNSDLDAVRQALNNPVFYNEIFPHRV